MNVSKPFLLNIIYILTNIFKIKINDHDNTSKKIIKSKNKNIKYIFNNNILINIWCIVIIYQL